MEWINVAAIVTSVAGAFIAYVGNQLLTKLKAFNGQHEELINMQQRFVVLEKDYGDLKRGHESLVESQRTQIKNTLVHVYETAREHEYIRATELEVANRLAECYYKLGGNSYISTIMKHLNSDFEIIGEIPCE